jgi:hypothetical protein
MMMPRIVEEPIGILQEYSRIPISFEVHSIFEVRLVDQGLHGLALSERRVRSLWVKDYDSHRGEGPMRWASRWDISNWGVISAFLSDRRVGAAGERHL